MGPQFASYRGQFRWQCGSLSVIHVARKILLNILTKDNFKYRAFIIGKRNKTHKRKNAGNMLQK